MILIFAQKSFVTATTTRRKQQQEMIHRALLAEEDRRRAARENFHLTTIPIMHQAAYEPALHHVSEDHEEGKTSSLSHYSVCMLMTSQDTPQLCSYSLLQSRWESGPTTPECIM